MVLVAQVSKLTNKQRELIEDNHNLIYGYANKYNIDLSEDDNYGLLATGLCKAAQKYNPEKGSFSTLVYFAMMSEIRHNHTAQTYLKRDIRKLDKYKDISELCDCKNIKHDDYVEDIIVGNLAYHDIMVYLKNSLSEKRYSIIQYIIKGYTREEIGKILNISHQAVTANVKIIKDTIREYYKGREN